MGRDGGQGGPYFAKIMIPKMEGFGVRQGIGLILAIAT